MSNEIKLTTSLLCENSTFKVERYTGQVNIDQNAIGRGGHCQLVGTSEEEIDFGDVSTEGLLWMRNVDPTNYVTWGPQVGTGNMQPLGRLHPGGAPAIFRVEPGVVILAQADTAACKVDVVLLED